jgi:hypothetical protein
MLYYLNFLTGKGSDFVLEVVMVGVRAVAASGRLQHYAALVHQPVEPMTLQH